MGELDVGDRVYVRRRDLFGRIEAEAPDHGPGHFLVKYELPYDPKAPAEVAKAGDMQPAWQVS